MPNKNKIKGNSFEREIVDKCKSFGLDAIRAWGSNGLSLGRKKEVDLLIEGWEVQCKKGYKQPTLRLKEFLTEVDFCVWSAADKRKDPDADFVFMTLDKFMDILQLLKESSKRKL